MQPTKVYKFAAATVMTTVAAATVITFTNAEQAGSSPVAAALPRVPAAGGAAPSVGINEHTPEPSALPSPVAGSEASPSPSPEPEPTTSSRSSARATSEPAKPKPKTKSPSPSHSPSRDGGLGGFLGDLLG